MRTCWIIIEDLVGLQNQGIGLAEALGVSYEIKHVTRPGSPWRFLPPTFWPNPLSLTTNGQPLTGPWPDLVISCGRCGVAPALEIARLSKGKTFTVHIQHPRVGVSRFGAVIVPEHDNLRGENVMSSFGALHRVTKKNLAAAADKFRERFAHLPRPLISVLVGGTTQNQIFTAEIAKDMTEKLAAAAKQTGGSIVLTPSRRTGKENEKIIRDVLADVPSYIWDGADENPYTAMLALADVLVVTSDSVSMTSEACFTGKPVYVYDFPVAGKRHAAYQKELVRRGMTRSFEGLIEKWTYAPLDETARAADFVRERFMKRTNLKAASGE